MHKIQASDLMFFLNCCHLVNVYPVCTLEALFYVAYGNSSNPGFATL